MKKQYIFLIFIIIILYLLYLIIEYKYKDYKINNYITNIKNTNLKLTDEILKNKKTLEYINTKAYKNKILKEQQGLKNIGEQVIFITNEDKYKKYTSNQTFEIKTNIEEKKEIWNNMENFEKWIYFLFKKDIR